MAVQCQAPFASMYLDSRGFARVCALNNGLPLGNVGRESILDLWRGAMAERLRDEFRSGGWGDGCEVCEWQARGAGADHSFARTFDHLAAATGEEPQWPRRIEFALGNTCNLRCVMCSGDVSSAIRTRDEHFEPLPDAYDERFFADLEVMAPHLEEARFLGGEPFMIPAHHRVWDLLATVHPRPRVHVTTNGTIWNRRVESVLEQFDTSIAVSLDGVTAETVERIRVGARHGEVMANVDRFLAYTRERGTHLGLTFCLMTENWHEFGAFLDQADALDVDAFVNVVTMPSRFSLLVLPPDELEGVIARLEAERGPDGRGLGRNRGVWVDQLDQLRARLATRTDDIVSWWRSTASRLTVADVVPPVEEDLAELEAWSGGGPTVVLEMDARDRIIEATPGDTFLHLPVAPAAHGFDELIVLLSSFYGRRTEIGLLRHQDDLEDRTARYETTDEVTDLRSINRRPAHDRVRMALTARRRPVTAVGPAAVGQPVVMRSSGARGATTSSHGSMGEPDEGRVPNSSVV